MITLSKSHQLSTFTMKHSLTLWTQYICKYKYILYTYVWMWLWYCSPTKSLWITSFLCCTETTLLFYDPLTTKPLKSLARALEFKGERKQAKLLTKLESWGYKTWVKQEIHPLNSHMLLKLSRPQLSPDPCHAFFYLHLLKWLDLLDKW